MSQPAQAVGSGFRWRIAPKRINRETFGPALIWTLFLTFLVGAPIVRVAGLPIPTILGCGVLLLFARKIFLGPKSVWLLASLSAIYLLLVSLVNRQYNPLLGFKDIFYFMIPVQFLLGMALFNTVFRTRPNLKAVFVTFCAGFLVFQLVVVIAEFVSFGPLLAVLRPYLQWFLLNTSSTDAQLDYLSLRPSGTLGNPVLLGVSAYIIGRFVSHVQKKPTYFIVALSLVILTASRTAAIAIVLAETVAFFAGPARKTRVSPRQIRNVFLLGLLLMGVITVMFMTIPFMRAYIDIIRSGGLSALSDDYSVTYRNQMIGWTLQQPERLLFGGLSLAEAPDAVDSEVLMRSLQFGILGYFALQAPVWSFLIWGIQSKSTTLTRYAVALLVFCLICSTTFSPFSNPYFVIWYAAIAGFWCASLKTGAGDEPLLQSKSPASGTVTAS